MIAEGSPRSGLEALLQYDSCSVLQVLCGVSGKDMCGNFWKRLFSEIKKAKKPYSIWGLFFFNCCAPIMYMLSPISVV